MGSGKESEVGLMGFEIERKWLLNELPQFIIKDLESFEKIQMIQAYLCRRPVIRIRRENDQYVLTYKGEGYKVREEYNLPLNESAFYDLLKKCTGTVIYKERYIIPLENGLNAELDVFKENHAGLLLLEVEFENEEEADSFEAPLWFGKEVTGLKKYTNSYISS